MLSRINKNFIYQMINEKYQKIHPKISLQEIEDRINCLAKLLDIYQNNSKYSFWVNDLENEFKKVEEEGGMLCLAKIINLSLVLQMTYDLKKITYTAQDLKSLLKLLPISLDEESLQKVLSLEDNISAISSKLPFNVYFDNISNLFFIYLEIVSAFQEEINLFYALEKINISNYLDSIIKEYESKTNFQYIPSSVVQMEFNYSAYEQGINNEDFVSFITLNENEELKKIKLIGYAGVGKTTTLEYICYLDALNFWEKKKIPVLISLIVVDKDIPIEVLIANKLNIGKENIEIVNFLIKNNYLNLYLDGVNEISILDSMVKRTFLNRLEDFVIKESNSALKVIVTDRDNDEVSVLNNCATYLIEGMTKKDVDAFVKGNTKKENVQMVQDILNEHEAMIPPIIEPIRLKNLIAIIEYEKKMPEDLDELSEIYLNAIIDREKNEKKDKLANYINGALTFLVKKTCEKTDWVSNAPTSYYKVIDTFNLYKQENNFDFDGEQLLNLIKKMGILKEVEFQKYAFTDENFFHIYYYQAIK